MTITTIPQIFDIAQDGEDVDGAVIVSKKVRDIYKSSPRFDTEQNNEVRALCRVLDAAFELGRSGGAYLVDDRQMNTLINKAIEAGLANKGRRA